MGPKVYAAIPAINESENLPMLIQDLINQKGISWVAVICINQPDEWWKIKEKTAICQNNRSSIEWLRSLKHPDIHIIDKSSEGYGWIGKNHGVGWARKTAMDAASALSGPDDLIVSMDADTRYPDNFFNSVIEAFKRYPGAVGLSAPYYHPLTGDETTDRCMLRYEIYMRNYAVNMLLIGNPYAFSAIGSGMACKSMTYKRIGGLTPKMSGEDFYFIQKLRKSGNIIVDSGVYIYPASRFSDRVYFGTGPAMIKGRDGNWESYPIYHTGLFQHIKRTYDLFGRLYDADIDTPMDRFLLDMTKGKAVWQPLRENSTTPGNFEKACMQKVDALRILQFLKENDSDCSESNELKLNIFINNKLNAGPEIRNILEKLNFEKTPVSDLNLIRNFLAENERSLQNQRRVV